MVARLVLSSTSHGSRRMCEIASAMAIVVQDRDSHKAKEEPSGSPITVSGVIPIFPN